MSHNQLPRMQRPISFRSLFTVFVICLFLSSAHGQSGTATLSGDVVDQNGAVIPGAAVMIVNPTTGFTRETTTNDSGLYRFPSLLPGTYSVTVRRDGFAPVQVPSLVLNVGDQKALQIQLKAGDINATVQVINEAPLINESPGVGTVVDRKYVENMPLNGRSVQDLILLTPGVLTNSPQTLAGGGRGEFSVNGQRTESNQYRVDGVSANVGIVAGVVATAATSGSLPVTTALGTTQGLLSVDAMQEFRIQTSTYAAEYGRSPGGQFLFVTRSGANQYHGTAFDYVRNDVFDANDWFNNYLGQPKSPLRQNDFGGTFSGPVMLPRFGEGGHQPGYNGRNRTFFFLAYEGLRLLQPQPPIPGSVPDLNLRVNAPAPLNQALNAFPVPNGVNLGNGLAQFVGVWSNPSRLDSTSVRLDHTLTKKLSLFFRFSDAPSSSKIRNSGAPSQVNTARSVIRTYTFGVTSLFSSRVTNEFRLNYSSDRESNFSTLENFGGATPVDLFALHGLDGLANPTPQVALFLFFGSQFAVLNQFSSTSIQKQWNVVDSLSLSSGKHQFKFGLDFRRLTPEISASNPAVTYFYFSASEVLANQMSFGSARATARAFPIYSNFSAFAQDEWRPTQRLNLSLGLRWEINPAPGARPGNLPFTVQGSSISTLSLAPQGTPLWNTTWFNFAPRLGAAYLLRNRPGRETLLRGGAGVFFDTGQQQGSIGYQGPGFSATASLSGAFPATLAKITPTIINPPTAPYPVTFAFSPHLQLPFTIQWSASIQQALGKSAVLTASYIGSNARRLLAAKQSFVSLFNPNFQSVVLFTNNALTADYHALELQIQRRLARGLQALGSYTWSHSIDFGSQNAALPFLRGNSDFDVRHSLSAAVSYDLSSPKRNGLARAALAGWGIDDRFTARTAFPVTITGGSQIFDPVTGQFFFQGLNLVTGQPLYVLGSACAALYNNGKGCPGGRAINPLAFAVPAAGKLGNAPRNFVRGFGAWQMDLAVRREFPIHEKLKLQFRAEAFNVFNHPNFGTVNPSPVNPFYCNPTTSAGCTFGQATGTLAQGLGGLNSLYQLGGPRSMQFSLKIIF